MEFKSIDTLSITECCEQLNLRKDDLPEVLSYVSGQNERDKLLIERLQSLLNEDKSAFESCRTIEQYEWYLSTWPDGLHHGYARTKIAELQSVAEEIYFYNRNKASISGLQAYIKRYPKGKFSREAKASLESKMKSRKIRNIILLIITTIVATVVCLINYLPVSYLDVPENLSFGKKGGYKTVSISTDANEANVEVQDFADWISVDRKGRTLSISVMPNTVDEKTEYITVNTYSSFFGKQFNCISKSIRVSQSSSLPTFLKTNISEVSFDKYGNCSSNYITAETDGCDLQVSTTGSWFNISKDIKEDGDNIIATITLSAGTNNAGSQTGEVVISCNDYVKRIKVSQDSGLATRFRVEKSSLIMAEEGGNYHLPVDTDGTSWIVHSCPDWLTAKANIDQKRLEVTVSRNNRQKLTGTITLKSNNGDLRDISVTQKGGPTNFKAAKSTIEFGTSSNYEYVTIYNDSDKNLSISEHESWLSATVINKNKIKISCESNNEDYSKSGTVYVYCGNEQISIKVTQKGGPTNFSTAKSTIKFGTSSDYEYVTIYNDSHKNISVSEYETWLNATVINKNKIKISCNRNYDDPPRSGTVYVRCGNKQVSITVKQDGWSKCRTCGGKGKIPCPKNGNMNLPFWSFLYENGIHYYVEWPMAYGVAASMKRYERCKTCGGSGHIDCPDCEKGKWHRSY